MFRLLFIIFIHFIHLTSSFRDYFQNYQDLLYGQDFKKSKFYIFDWPVEIQSSTPPKHVKLIQHSKVDVYTHHQGENFGNGHLLDEKYAIYQSSVHQFYFFIMSKLRVHPRRTFNYSEASFYIMPYDIGFAAAFDQKTGEFLEKPWGAGCPESKEVIQLLQTEIQRTGLWGHNILIINSLNDIFPLHCREIITICLNCTIIGSDLEDYKENKLYKPLVSLPGINRRVFSAPFQTFHRWNEKHSQFASFINLPINLSDEVLSRFHPSIRTNYSRPIFASFWGSNFVWYNPATTIRTILSATCSSHPDYCYYLPASNRLQSSASKNLTAIEMYSNSVFCFQPSGDLESRKGIFDSFAVGCIPILSANGVLHKTYPWFFTKEMEQKLAVYIPHAIVTQHNFDVITEILLKIPIEVIQQKRESIESIAKSIQYAVPPESMRDYIGHGGGPSLMDGKKRWRPPFDDAIDRIIDSMSNISNRYRETRTISEDEAPNRVGRWEYMWLENSSPRNPHPIEIN